MVQDNTKDNNVFAFNEVLNQQIDEEYWLL